MPGAIPGGKGPDDDRVEGIRAGKGCNAARRFTASAMTEDRNDCLAAGIDDHLSKPINPLELDGILTRWADGDDDPPARLVADAQEERRSLDPTRLAVLRELDPGGHSRLLEALLDAFRDQAVSDLATLEGAIVSGDETIVARRAHSLKGAAADVGANGVRDVCAVLEAVAPCAGSDELTALVAELRAELEWVQRAIDLEVTKAANDAD